MLPGLDTEPKVGETCLWGQWSLLLTRSHSVLSLEAAQALVSPGFRREASALPEEGPPLRFGDTVVSCADPDPWQSQVGALACVRGSVPVESVATTPLPSTEVPVHGQALGSRLRVGQPGPNLGLRDWCGRGKDRWGDRSKPLRDLRFPASEPPF